MVPDGLQTRVSRAFHHPQKGAGEAFGGLSKVEAVGYMLPCGVFPVKPERQRAICDSHTCQCILNPSYHYCSSPRGNAYFCTFDQHLVSKAAGLKQLCTGSTRLAHWTGKGRAHFGSRVPVGNGVFSEVTAIYLGGAANGVNLLRNWHHKDVSS